MNNYNQLKPNIATESEIDSIGLIDLLLIFAKHKRKVIFLPIAFGFFGILGSFALPDIYRANTKILPPQQNQSSASAMLSQLGGLAGGASAALGIKNPNDLYISLLRSRILTDKLIEKFDLKARYNQKYLENVRAQLEASSFINSGKDNIISIDVEDKDPNIASAIANAYAEELSKLTSKFALTEASQRRIFYEKQLELTKEKMVAAENALASNIPNSGLISIDSQSKAVLETTAKLRANISAKEIQLKAIQAFVTPNSLQYKSAYQELNGMKSELIKLESGSISEKTSEKYSQLDATSNTKKSPHAGATNFQLLRDVKYHQMLYEMLAKQFELARLDEVKDLPVIQVLDQAIVPEIKFKPKRALFAISSFFLGLIIALLSIYISEKIFNSNSEEKRRKIKELKDSLGFFK